MNIVTEEQNSFYDNINHIRTPYENLIFIPNGGTVYFLSSNSSERLMVFFRISFTLKVLLNILKQKKNYEKKIFLTNQEFPPPRSTCLDLGTTCMPRGADSILPSSPVPSPYSTQSLFLLGNDNDNDNDNDDNNSNNNNTN